MATGSHLWFSPLSHHWRNLVDTLPMNSSWCVDVSAWKRFQSVNKYGQMAAIFKIAQCPLLNTVTIWLSHLLQDHWSNFFETCLTSSTSSLVVSARKWFRSINKCGWTVAIFKIMNWPLLNTVTSLLSHLLQDHWLDFFKLRCSTSSRVVFAQK